MALPGLLIEYFVSGAMALLWLMLTKWEPQISALGAKLPILVLVLYVTGMAIDMIAFFVTRAPKRWLRKKVFRIYRPNEDADRGSGTERQARIALHAPELGKELAMRSSRDRIARGLIVNSLFALFLLDPWWVGAIAVVCSSAMWMSFERLSYGYELCADKVVEEKLHMAAKI
jgi:hypothetical protein